jgi:hypothetical protein
MRKTSRTNACACACSLRAPTKQAQGQLTVYLGGAWHVLIFSNQSPVQLPVERIQVCNTWRYIAKAADGNSRLQRQFKIGMLFGRFGDRGSHIVALVITRDSLQGPPTYSENTGSALDRVVRVGACVHLDRFCITVGACVAPVVMKELKPGLATDDPFGMTCCNNTNLHSIE